MSIYQPKRKTNSGTEAVTFPISAVNGLGEKIDGKTLAMPRIRVGAVGDIDATLVPTDANPLNFTVEIIDGKLEIGDQIQICTRQLFTYDEGRRKKYRLRRMWQVIITDQTVNHRIIQVPIYNSGSKKDKRLYKTGNVANHSTLSPLYIRVRRPIIIDGKDNDGRFSNIVTVWKKYDRDTGKIFIK